VQAALVAYAYDSTTEVADEASSSPAASGSKNKDKGKSSKGSASSEGMADAMKGGLGEQMKGSSTDFDSEGSTREQLEVRKLGGKV